MGLPPLLGGPTDHRTASPTEVCVGILWAWRFAWFEYIYILQLFLWTNDKRKAWKLDKVSCDFKVAGLNGHSPWEGTSVLMLSGQHLKAAVISCCGQTKPGKAKFTSLLWQTAGGTEYIVGGLQAQASQLFLAFYKFRIIHVFIKLFIYHMQTWKGKHLYFLNSGSISPSF